MKSSKNKDAAFYIFHFNLNAFKHWRRKYPHIRALWYDGKSTLLNGLLDMFNVEALVIEENILESVQTSLSHELPSNTLIQPRLTIPRDKKLSKLCLFPSNDTHVHLFQNLLHQSGDFNIIVPSGEDENASSALNQLNIPYQSVSIKRERFEEFVGLLVATDWGFNELIAINKFQRSKKPTMCLQESVIHFSDQLRRMEWCDYPFIQGISTLKFLNRDVNFLTGNPRYEQLTPTSPINDNFALVNCNFTYGVYEDVRAGWIKDVTDACRQTKFDYLIAQHPRDWGDLSRYNSLRSNAGVIHNLIQSSSITITRFSSIIHESLALGRSVIYYNPHDENMYYDFEPDQIHLKVAKSKTELVSALNSLRADQIEDPVDDEYYETYGAIHYGSTDSLASTRVAQAANIVMNLDERIGKPSPFPFQFINQNYSTLRVIKKKLLKRTS